MEGNYCYKYPRPAVTTDCVVCSVTNHKFEVLLVKRANEPFKDMWALPGGFLEENETLEECACRELEEYACKRLSHCPFGEEKPTCRLCTVHCYKPQMKERMKKVMRYAGPRMLLYHPIAAVRHLWREYFSK